MSDTIASHAVEIERALITVGHFQLIAVYLILSTGARYHEFGAKYV